jgi:hypothetical protein
VLRGVTHRIMTDFQIILHFVLSFLWRNTPEDSHLQECDERNVQTCSSVMLRPLLNSKAHRHPYFEENSKPRVLCISSLRLVQLYFRPIRLRIELPSCWTDSSKVKVTQESVAFTNQ